MKLALTILALAASASAADYITLTGLARTATTGARQIPTVNGQRKLEDALVLMDLNLMGLSVNPPVSERQPIVELRNNLLFDLEQTRDRARKSTGAARTLEVQNINRLLNLIRWTDIEIAEMRAQQRKNVSPAEVRRITGIRNRIRHLLRRSEAARAKLSIIEKAISLQQGA